MENELSSSKPEKFYDDAKKYWAEIKPTVDGMLGGYAHISSTDIAGSDNFIKPFLKPRGKTEKNKALDCGAGIGRITKRLLLPLFAEVDMVELTQSFLDEARDKYLGQEQVKKIGNFFCSGLEDFTPEEGRYDVIWSQWVLGQLKDDHLVEFFKRCQKGLSQNGIFFIKENVSKGEVDFDEDDSSYCRPRDLLVSLMKQAGLTILKEDRQKNFPKELYDVRMFALQ